MPMEAGLENSPASVYGTLHIGAFPYKPHGKVCGNRNAVNCTAIYELLGTGNCYKVCVFNGFATVSYGY